MNLPVQNQPIRKSLALVVGAGASFEVSLPLGSELKNQIAMLLDFQFNDYGRKEHSHGDNLIFQAFSQLISQADGQQGDISTYINASKQIRDAMPLAISIDNFIDAHRGNKSIEIVGKLAIVRSILDAEAKSTLAIDLSNIYNRLRFENIKSTWFSSFFQLLTENCQADSLPHRFEQIAIICFNYDRCIEHYLFNALKNYYKMSPEEVANALTKLKIYHPYGTVGQLPWMGGAGQIEYGKQPSEIQLIQLAERIRTFTEGSNIEGSDIVEVRNVLNESERIAFLGFAFHRQNLELLFPPHPNGFLKKRDCSIFATGIGISVPDSEAIQKELSSLICIKPSAVDIALNTPCAQLFEDYRRSLSFR
jgi:hypothetical protein